MSLPGPVGGQLAPTREIENVDLTRDELAWTHGRSTGPTKLLDEAEDVDLTPMTAIFEWGSVS